MNLILISGCLLFAGVSLSLISPFYPSEALAKGVSVTQSGLVMGTVFIATIIFTPLCGMYIDTLGARKFLLLGSFICALGNIGFGFLDKVEGSTLFFSLSILIRIFVALGESAMTPACYTLAAQQVGENHQGKAISAAEAFFGMGTMFGPSLGGALYQYGGFSLPFWISGGILIMLVILLVFLLEDKSDLYTRLDEEQTVSWMQVVRAPGVMISLFALSFAGSSWSWYSATLDPYLSHQFDLSSAQTGLVFTAFGAAYTIATPLFGFLSDKGLDGMVALMLGNALIAFSYIFLGPIPGLEIISGHLWLTVASIAVMGLGSAATYLGSLLLMMKGVKDAGLPETEQTKSMVSSLWIVADCLGGYAGSTLGSIAYDNIGFKYSTLVEALLMGLTVLVVALVSTSKYYSCPRCRPVRDLEADFQVNEGKEERRRLLKATDAKVYGS